MGRQRIASSVPAWAIIQNGHAEHFTPTPAMHAHACTHTHTHHLQKLPILWRWKQEDQKFVLATQVRLPEFYS